MSDTTQVKLDKMTRQRNVLIGLVLVAVLFSCFGGMAFGALQTPDDSSAEVREVTRIVEIPVGEGEVVEVPVEVTRIVEVETEVEVPVEVTRIVEVEAEYPPMPREEFLFLEGNGKFISENYHWGECPKAVFYSTVPGAVNDNFIAMVQPVDATGVFDGNLIANIFGISEDQSVVHLTAGDYYIEVELAPNSGGWTIRGECQS